MIPSTKTRVRRLIPSENPICGNCKKFVELTKVKCYCSALDKPEARRKSRRKRTDPACGDGYDEIVLNPKYNQ